MNTTAEHPKVAQTSRGYLQANPVEIKRSIKSLERRELEVAKAEKKLAASAPGTSHYEALKATLERHRQKRDFTLARFEALLDHAVKHTPLNKSRQAQAAVPFLNYVNKCKEDIILCAKVRGGGNEKDQAFERLLTKWDYIFRPHLKTSPLDPDDALVLAQKGIWDAALRFDAVKNDDRTSERKHFAVFGTYAYNWVMRNTRSRSNWDTADRSLKSYDGYLRFTESQAKSMEHDNFVRKQAKLHAPSSL